jgi:hypothetical protein
MINIPGFKCPVLLERLKKWKGLQEFGFENLQAAFCGSPTVHSNKKLPIIPPGVLNPY